MRSHRSRDLPMARRTHVGARFCGGVAHMLRLVDVPLPSIYGPTADEKW